MLSSHLLSTVLFSCAFHLDLEKGRLKLSARFLRRQKSVVKSDYSSVYRDFGEGGEVKCCLLDLGFKSYV